MANYLSDPNVVNALSEAGIDGNNPNYLDVAVPRFNEHFRQVYLQNIAPWKNPEWQYAPGYATEEGVYKGTPDPILTTFGGEKAKGFANALVKFIGKYDKKPRFEIDDSLAVLNLDSIPKGKSRTEIAEDYLRTKHGRTEQFPIGNPKVPSELQGEALRFADANQDIIEVPLSQVFKHDELYANYPHLKDAKLSIEKNMGLKGHYDPATNSIRIGGGLVTDNPRETLLHEIQHAIQEYEGFAKGGITKQFDELPVTIKEAVVGADIGNITHPNEWKQIFGPENPLGIATAANELKVGGLLTKAEIGQLEKVAEKHGFKSFDEMKDYLKSQADFRSPEGQYTRLAGEIEARDVAERANLTPEQRLATEPYSSENIPVENAIVRFR